MDQNSFLSPSDLPAELRDALGPVRGAMLEGPGVYYVGLEPDGSSIVADEYYVVEADTPVISDDQHRVEKLRRFHNYAHSAGGHGLLWLYTVWRC